MSLKVCSSIDDAVEYLSTGDSLLSKRHYGSGGCINETYLLTLSSGKKFFIKENDRSPENMFFKEAAGLKVLSEKFQLKVPRALVLGKEGKRDFLILEYIHSSRQENRFWENFGSAMAQMHKAGGSDTYGFDSDNYIGSTKQINRTMPKWTDFFCINRLLFQVELARSNNLADRSISSGVEKICNRITSLLPEPDFPSLLHGDLWSGNYMVDDKGQAVLIDPAVYYGHREADLAMTELFGGFNRIFYQSYNDLFSLDKGYAQRKDLYNLYHMLNHLNLFGSSYGGSVRSIISAYL
ncbi:MAG: fructosamine kinase family protein [Spirochaetaceae bacterium]|jgi:protein-ribulosamine 3-kinase|nr:fructosamine kinase family protein [Spirochaetaceae bacterium]